MTTSTRNAAAYRLGVLASQRRARLTVRLEPSERAHLERLFGRDWLRLFRRGLRGAQ